MAARRLPHEARGAHRWVMAGACEWLPPLLRHAVLCEGLLLLYLFERARRVAGTWRRTMGGGGRGRTHWGRGGFLVFGLLALFPTAHAAVDMQGAREERAAVIVAAAVAAVAAAKAARGRRGRQWREEVAAEEERWTTFRVATWNMSKGAAGGPEQGAGRRKLTWLQRRLEQEAIDVLVLQEVAPSVAAERHLRRWFNRQGYGLSRRVRRRPGFAQGRSETLCVAWRRETCESEGDAVEVADGVVGVVVIRKADDAQLAVVDVHGVHGDEDACVAQFEAAASWAGSQAEGLIMGDFNRVACVQERRARRHVPTRADLLLRAWRGDAGCTCCAAPAARAWGGVWGRVM